MKIGFDAKRAFLNTTGLGNYSRSLLEGLATFFPGNEYHLFSPTLPDNRQTVSLHQNKAFYRHSHEKLFPGLWRSKGIVEELKRLNLDLYHGLSNEIPFGLAKTGIRSVVSIHDLIFYRYPKQYGLLDRQIYDIKFRYACQSADRVVAISQATKNDILEFYQLPESRVQVIYQSCSPAFYELLGSEEKQRVREKYQLPPQYLLYVGSIIPRKNLAGIVKAMALIPKADRLPLLIIGSGKLYVEQVWNLARKLGLEKELIWKNEIDFTDFPAIYQQAKMMIYPSFYEGFGLPVLEALASSLPVITSTQASLPEAGGPGSYYVEPDQPEALAEGIRRLLSDEDLRQKMSRQGWNHAQQFLPERLLPQWILLYSELISQ